MSKSAKKTPTKKINNKKKTPKNKAANSTTTKTAKKTVAKKKTAANKKAGQTTTRKKAKKAKAPKKATPAKKKAAKKPTVQLPPQLQAGGFVSVSAKVDPNTVEDVVARSYGGAAMGERVVVQLGPSRLGPAEDLAMEYLGLEAKGTSDTLAHQARRALGFAHWALLHHPKHAKFALNLVKRIKATARRAKSKPGHAWDEFVVMASELNKSARHFLPTFWEEAARIYKDLGNQTYAGRSLNKALEAERVHGLEVDREHRRDAVLEFTLSGCLSGKALSEYAKDLQKQFEPDEAYATFRDLAIRRALGGMAPTANMGKDLLRLLKTTDLDVDEETESFLSELISAPSMSRAPLQFWKSLKTYVKRLVEKDEVFATWLLVHTDPQSSYTGDSPVWAWLDYLDDCRVLPLLSRAKLPAEPEIPGGRAGWIARLAAVETSPHKRVLELLEQMATTLKAEKQPIPLVAKQRWGTPHIDVDVLEAVLQLGLDVTDLSVEFDLNFDGWLRAEVDHPMRNSQLSIVAKDDRFSHKLKESLPDLIAFKGTPKSQGFYYGRSLPKQRSFEDAAADHPAISDIWWEHLQAQVDRVKTGGLADAEDGLAELRRCTGSKTSAEFPELLALVKSLDLNENLFRTIRAGVLDEYGWPALDAIQQDRPLPSFSKRKVTAKWIFPTLTYLANGSITVVRPDSADDPRPFSLSAKRELLFMVPVDDDILVGYQNQRNWESFLIWLSDSKNEIPLKGGYYFFQPTEMVPVNDGVFMGGRTLKKGDDRVSEISKFFHDNKRFWRVKEDYYALHSQEVYSDAPNPIYEVDPDTNEKLRDSVPPWFEKHLSGGTLNWTHCNLLPAPEQPGESPLGSENGLIGWKVIKRRNGTFVGMGIDGRQANLNDYKNKPHFRGLEPIAMMDQPCGDAPWILVDGGDVVDSKSGRCIWKLSSTRTTYTAGQPAPIPHPFLHLMRVRHEPSSSKLRRFTRNHAESFLEAGKTEHQAMREQPKEKTEKHTAAATAVKEYLPDAPEPLVAGLARIARLAAEETISLAKLIDKLSQVEPAQAPKKQRNSQVFVEGLAQLKISVPGNERRYSPSGSASDYQHLCAAIKFLQGGTTDKKLPGYSTCWFHLLSDLPKVCWSSFWHIVTNEGSSIAERLDEPWLAVLEFFAESGILDLPGQYRIYDVHRPRSNKSSTKTKKPFSFTKGSSRYICIPQDRWRTHTEWSFILEYSTNKKFQIPDDYTIDQTDDVDIAWNSKQLTSFIEAVRSVQKIPFATSEQLQDASEVLGVSAVEVGLVWMANLRTVMYGQEKLTKEIREFYGWKVKDIQQAISSLDATPVSNSVYSAALSRYPSTAFGSDQPSAFQALVKEWKRTQKTTARLSPELISLIDKSIPHYGSSPTETIVKLLTAPTDSTILMDRAVTFEASGRSHRGVDVAYDPELTGDHAVVFSNLSYVIGLINYAVPNGSEVRSRLPAVIEACRQFLERETTLLEFGCQWTTTDFDSVDKEKVIDQFSTVLPNLELGKDGIHRHDDPLLFVGLLPPYVSLLFRPSGFQNQTDFDRLLALASMTCDWSSSGENEIENLHVVQQLRSEGITEIAETNQQADPTDEQQSDRWDQDPNMSAPKIVEAAKRKFKLKDDSATLYLQLLALPDPSLANIRKWNDWTAKEFKQAVAPLVEAELIVEAKRARAGRDVFLPGGWEALKTPNLPIESWKLPMFGLESDTLSSGRMQLIVPLEPVGRLFERAWNRIKSGDVPKYEEVES